MKRFFIASAPMLLGLALLSAPATAKVATQTVSGLGAEVLIERDEFNIPRITGESETDVIFGLGMVHAEDRFFQMDTLRRTFKGTLAEILGEGALSSDIELRTLGLDRAANDSFEVIDPVTQDWIQAYTDGVNAWLNEPANQLPPEYAALEITKEGVPEWTVLDTMVISKGLAFGLSFDLIDLELTEGLLELQAAGKLNGFDGTAMFVEDVYRTAPFDPTIVIPNALTSKPGPAPQPNEKAGYLNDSTLRLIRQFKERAQGIPVLEKALAGHQADKGSNWWIVSGNLTPSGLTALANDPHLDLTQAPIFYEAHLIVSVDGTQTLNTAGVSFPGSAGIVLGCNPAACWGGTVNPMDAVDIYQEKVIIDPFLGIGTEFDGKFETVAIVPQFFQVNQIGDGIDNNTAAADVGLFEGGLTFVVPRRNNGPVISVDISDPSNVTALSVQYTGWSATREVDAIRMFATADTPEKFKDALQYFDFGSQNWSYADRNGNIAYFTSAENPLREDLQNMEAPDGGVAPYFIRDGTHTLKHEWLPLENPQPGQAIDFEILPFDEMPQTINPEQGYVISANNDPVGTTLDNNAINEMRPGGGVFYLNPGYATGLRAGRLQRLFDKALVDNDGKVRITDVIRFQSNHQLFDAEVFVPFLDEALKNAERPGAPPELAALGADPAVAEAVGRFTGWDFSTPTGLADGYDPGDDPDNLPAPTQKEIDASVAASIYAAWRGQILQTVVDGTLESFGIAVRPRAQLAMTSLRNLLDNFPVAQGIGASGVDFFVVDGVDDANDERDVILLQAVKDALDLFAGDGFAAAFANSTDQNDYRWGKLHRIVYDHPLGGDFNIPPAGGLSDLDEGLVGLARSGGYGAVDASNHDVRADSLDDFMFGSGPARRFVGRLDRDVITLLETLPGGQSGVVGSPFQADQLRLWLTGRYHVMPPENFSGGNVVRLVPEKVVSESLPPTQE